MRRFELLGGIAIAVAGLLLAGCASTGDSARADRLTQQVGQYPPPPAGVERPKVGVPPFVQVQAAPGTFASGAPQGLDQLAADQMSSLMHMSRRFDVIERAQLEQLLREQDLEGIVRPEQMARMGEVEGVDYLLIGRVTNFRVRSDQTQRGVDAGGLTRAVGGDRFGRGQTGFDQRETRITTECGVDIRLVDPTTGRVVASHFGEFNRTDSARAMGVRVMGVGGQADANVQIERDDAGRILRLAFDEALRNMIPEIDALLMSRPRPEGEARAVAPTPTADTDAPQAARFCPQCGGQLASGARFCAGCGAAVP